MKKLLVVPVLIFLFVATGFAQQASAIAGSWMGQFPGQDGKPVKFKMTITDNTYQMDIGMDGVADVTGSYTSAGDQVTIWDTAGENTCPADQKGVYKFAVDGDTLTFTKVKDDCPSRGDETMVVTRM